MAWSLYNKYRPSTFSEVVGQEHVEKTLMNAVVTNTVSHAYLFAGPRGTGKTTTARLLAKALLCDLAPTDHPDGSCQHCQEIAEGTHPDVYELDAASRTGVENVREEIIGRVQFAPTHGKWKIYIIDEVHMLTKPAFNALLKTLEEPPAHVIFVLCTTDAHKVLPTIQSRCQRFDFRRLSVEQIVARLAWISEQEGYHADARALELIARRSQGGLRDAIGSLEQVAVYSGGQIDFEAVESMIGEINAEQLFALADTLARRDAAASFSWVADFVLGGTDIALLVSDFAGYVRNLYLTALSRDDERLREILAVGPDELARYRIQAKDFGSVERLEYVLTVLGDLTSELKSAPNARLALEIACARVIRPQGERGIEALAARIADVEKALAQGALRGDAAVASGRDPGHAAPAAVIVALAEGSAVEKTEVVPVSATPAAASEHSNPAFLDAAGSVTVGVESTTEPEPVSTTAPATAPEPVATPAATPEPATAPANPGATPAVGPSATPGALPAANLGATPSATPAAESGATRAEASAAESDVAPAAMSEPATTPKPATTPDATSAADPDATPGVMPAATESRRDIHGLWLRVIEAAKKESRSVGMRLVGSRASLKGDVVMVELPTGANFARQLLEEAEHLALVRAILAKLGGTEYALRFVVAASPTNEPATGSDVNVASTLLPADTFASVLTDEAPTSTNALDGASAASAPALASTSASAFSGASPAADEPLSSAAEAVPPAADELSPPTSGISPPSTTEKPVLVSISKATAEKGAAACEPALIDTLGATTETTLPLGVDTLPSPEGATPPSPDKEDLATMLSASLGVAVRLEEAASPPVP